MTLPQAELLLVEDEPLVRSSLRRLFSVSARVHEADSFDDAIEALCSGTFDLVVCDFSLGPGKNGLDVLDWVANTQPSARRVLVTGSIAREIGLDLVDAGRVDAFFYKGDDPAELHDYVRRCSLAVDAE